MRFAILLSLLAALIAAALPASAHFSEGTKVRTIIVSTAGDGIRLQVRSPLPLIFASEIVTAQQTRVPLSSPLLAFEQTGGGPRFRVLMDRLEADPLWSDLVQRALVWSVNGVEVAPDLIRWRVLAREDGAAFTTPADASMALDGPSSRLDPVFRDAVAVWEMRLPGTPRDAALSVGAGVPEMPLPADVEIDNLIVDARDVGGDGGDGQAVTVAGQLMTPFVIDGSLFGTLRHFAAQGVLHILEGLDHVLLVVCLGLGAGASWRLAWLVTAFTLGHSVTLAAAVFGYVPEAAWFIPAVELGIAGTVLFAAVAGLMRWPGTTVAVLAIGLLHGFGFSFVLGEILGPGAPNLVPALAGFNVGIEAGQLSILAATLGAVWLVGRFGTRGSRITRSAVLTGIGAIAAFWMVERTALLLS